MWNEYIEIWENPNSFNYTFNFIISEGHNGAIKDLLWPKNHSISYCRWKGEMLEAIYIIFFK